MIAVLLVYLLGGATGGRSGWGATREVSVELCPAQALGGELSGAGRNESRLEHDGGTSRQRRQGCSESETRGGWLLGEHEDGRQWGDRLERKGGDRVARMASGEERGERAREERGTGEMGEAMGEPEPGNTTAMAAWPEQNGKSWGVSRVNDTDPDSESVTVATVGNAVSVSPANDSNVSNASTVSDATHARETREMRIQRKRSNES